MIISSTLKLEEQHDYGLVILCEDTEMADRLDDYLTEIYDSELFIKFQDDTALFFVGRKASPEKIVALLQDFARVDVDKRGGGLVREPKADLSPSTPSPVYVTGSDHRDSG